MKVKHNPRFQPRRTGYDSGRGHSRIFACGGSYRTMPLVGVFSQGSPVSPPVHSGTAPYSPLNTLISSQGGAVAMRLHSSPPTYANRVQSSAGPLPDLHKWESCRTTPLVRRAFSEISRLPPPFHSAVLYNRLDSPSSALKTSMDVSNYQTWYEICPCTAGNAMTGATLARIPAAMADLAQAFTGSDLYQPRTLCNDMASMFTNDVEEWTSQRSGCTRMQGGVIDPGGARTMKGCVPTNRTREVSGVGRRGRRWGQEGNNLLGRGCAGGFGEEERLVDEFLMSWWSERNISYLSHERVMDRQRKGPGIENLDWHDPGTGGGGGRARPCLNSVITSVGRCGGAFSLLASHQGEPGHSQIFPCGNLAGLFHWSGGFLEDLVSPLAFWCCSIPHFTLIGSQDLNRLTRSEPPVSQPFLRSCGECTRELVANSASKHAPREISFATFDSVDVHALQSCSELAADPKRQHASRVVLAVDRVFLSNPATLDLSVAEAPTRHTSHHRDYVVPQHKFKLSVVPKCRRLFIEIQLQSRADVCSAAGIRIIQENEHVKG
ncbi:hypothetical protein PR048_011842 [Dryococelus australis]|uniref:Uncharacterized protein n=1 Tax=Dryococelus australis TaxID=614101 RepID=A0ABQ9HMN7_9NEOP|nr:hypothetical protein PR048_011842 [Dryococelus australis]